MAACTNEEIIAGFDDQRITACRRESLLNETIYTNTYIITFNKLQLQEILKIGYLLVRVEQYLPVPLRCTKCQKFGHHATKCRNPKYTCWRRSKHYEPDHCPSGDPKICINFQGIIHPPPKISCF